MSDAEYIFEEQEIRDCETFWMILNTSWDYRANHLKWSFLCVISRGKTRRVCVSSILTAAEAAAHIQGVQPKSGHLCKHHKLRRSLTS